MKEKIDKLFEIIEQSIKLPKASSGTGPDGSMFYCWDQNEHHLEIEIFEDKDTEFFYRNRLTDEIFGYDYSDGELPKEVLDKLENFRL